MKKTYFGLALTVFILSLILWRQTTHLHQVHVACKTTKGELEIVVMPEWSPRGAQRFLEMVDEGYFTNLPLFRCIDGFICQFGPTFPKANAKPYPTLIDDPAIPNLRHFKKGYMSFAGYGPNTRSTHIFIALGEPASLGSQPWETPFAYVTQTTFDATAAKFTTRYGEMAPTGNGPDGPTIEGPGGEEYLRTHFPELDYFEACSIQGRNP